MPLPGGVRVIIINNLIILHLIFFFFFFFEKLSKARTSIFYKCVQIMYACNIDVLAKNNLRITLEISVGLL